MFLSIGMLKQNYFLADIFILSAEKQPIKLSWRKIECLLTLPVDKNGQPYWEYMENYMRNIENQQIFNYFKTLGLIK